MTNNNTRANLKGYFSFLLVAVIVPVIALLTGLKYMGSVLAEVRLREYQIQANDILENLRVSANSGEYIARRFNDAFDESSSPEKLFDAIMQLRHETELDFEFLVWNRDGDVFKATFDWQTPVVDWKLAFQTLEMLRRNSTSVMPDSEMDNARRIYGMHFFPEMHVRCYAGKNPEPMQTDGSLKNGPVWMRTSKKLGLSVHFAIGALDKLPGLDSYIEEGVGDFKIALIADGQIKSSPGLELQLDELQKLSDSFENPQAYKEWYFFKNYVSERIFAFCLLPADSVSGFAYTEPVLFILSILALIVCFVVVKSYRVYCQAGKLSGFNVRRQLVALFLLVNTVSMLILGFLAFDYLHQYELQLHTDAFATGMAFLQSADEMYVSEFSTQFAKVDKALNEIRSELREKGPTINIMNTLVEAQGYEVFRMFLVGSNTPVVGCDIGLMQSGSFVEIIDTVAKTQKSYAMLVDSMGRLGKYYLSLLNGQQLPQSVVTQVELIAESIGQIRPKEMFQEFFASHGSFWQWGMGSNYYPAHIRIFSFNDPNIIDYVFISLWNAKVLQYNYVMSKIIDYNRNDLGLKVMAIDEGMTYSYPTELMNDPQLLPFSTRLKDRTGTEIAFCQWDGEEHMLMGLKCTSMNSVRLLGLYPLSKIWNAVASKQRLFVGFALLSFLVSIALGLIVARSVLAPLSQLQVGMQALQKREFSYRLPDLGTDEFGDLARIFNTTLIDLEELHVASIVQDKLVEKIQDTVCAGELSYFGGSCSFFRLGGDYLEVFNVDEEHLAVVIGDVAGQGVGAALVLAFIKSCVLQLKSLYAQPQKFVTRINELVTATNKRRHRKFMTFQYAFINVKTRQIEIANAGHCYPLVLTQSRLRAIEVPSAPLGAAKKANIATTRFTLESGEKLALYSGGVFRNQGLDFDIFCQTFLESDDPDPQNHYNEFMSKTFARVNRESCNDDLSLLIIGDRISERA